MVHYIYKSEQAQDQWYIDCEWLNNIDFETNSPDLQLCTITLNNVVDYWSGSVTRKDLDNFENQNASFDQLNQVVSLGLRGESDFEGQALSWKITQERNTCKMTLIGFMAGTLPYELGFIHIPKVSASHKHRVMKNWMENTMKQCLTFKNTQKALLERNRDLVEYKERMEKELEDLTREKVESDMTTIQKMKLLVNSKKRRIHKVMLERDRLLKQLEQQQASSDEKHDGDRTRRSTSPKNTTTAVTKKRGRPSNSAATKDENIHSKRARTTNATTPSSSQPTSNMDDNIPQQDTESIVKIEDIEEPASVPKATASSSKTFNGNNSTKPANLHHYDSTDDDDDEEMMGVKLKKRITSKKSKNKGKQLARNASDDSDTE